MVMGHSLGEYGALVAAGVMPFADALEAAAARGREMTQRLPRATTGRWPRSWPRVDVVESRSSQAIDGYVVAANINSRGAVRHRRGLGRGRGGRRGAPEARLPRHAPPGQPRLPHEDRRPRERAAPEGPRPPRRVARRSCRSSRTSRAASTRQTPDEIKEILSAADRLARAVGRRASRRSRPKGARTFVEVGPKRALKGFVDDVLEGRDGLVSLFTNRAEAAATSRRFNQALCGLWAAGHGAPGGDGSSRLSPTRRPRRPSGAPPSALRRRSPSCSALLSETLASARRRPPRGGSRPERGPRRARSSSAAPASAFPAPTSRSWTRRTPRGSSRGEQFIDLLPERFRKAMRDRSASRARQGRGRERPLRDDREHRRRHQARGAPGRLRPRRGIRPPREARRGARHDDAARHRRGPRRPARGRDPARPDLEEDDDREVPPRPVAPPGAAARRDGRHLRERLPRLQPLRRRADALLRATRRGGRRGRRSRTSSATTRTPGRARRSAARIDVLDDEIARNPYAFDRRFLFRILSMGHSQFAEYVGARGPNTQVNAACASTAAGDRARRGLDPRRALPPRPRHRRRRRHERGLFPWIGAGFLATGAAATDDKVEEAALPFDRRRHGTLDRDGGLRPRRREPGRGGGARDARPRRAPLHRDAEQRLPRHAPRRGATSRRSSRASSPRAERRFGIDRRAIARETVFMSHETFTPARGGSASAEVAALRERLRPRGERDRRREHEGVHRPPDGGRDRGRHRREDPRARHRPPRPELPRGRPRPRPR